MWIHRAGDGRLLAVNDALARRTGWSPDELTVLTVDTLITLIDPALLFRSSPVAELIAGGTVHCRDGGRFEVELNVQETTFDGEAAFVVVAADVTRRRTDDDTLRKRQRQLLDAQELAHVGSFEWEIESDQVRWSDELYRIYGVAPQEFEATYEAFLERIHPDDRARVDAAIRRCIATGQPFEMEERILRPDGSVGVLETRGRLLPGVKRLIGVCRDVTELRVAEREREEARRTAEAAHAQVREILERVTDAFVALDRNWRYVYVNERAAEIFGHDRAWFIGRHIWTEFPEGVGQPFHLAYERAMETQQPQEIEEYYPPYDKWFQNRIYPSPNGLSIYFQDVTERRRREDELREARDRLARTEEFSLVMVTQIALDGTWIRLPANLAALLGYTHEELWKMNAEQVIHPDDLADDRMHRDRIVRGETRSEDLELRLLRKDGSIIWVYLNCSGVYDSDDRLTHLIVYLRDITDHHRAEERIRYQTLHDDLTGLPNRVLFNDRLEHALSLAQRHRGHVAVISSNLDNFKLVNDNFGHAVGDVVIREIAGRLTSSMRATHTLARLGGDEFAIIAEEIADEAEAREVAAMVARAVAEPCDVNGHLVQLTVSIGISIYPAHGCDAETLLRSSESALHRARELGRDNVQMFNESMSGRYRDRLAREQELRGALSERQFLVYYQPILRAADDRVSAVEALIRWEHPTRGIVGPDEFIPLAEETRLIVPVGEYVLASACEEIQRLLASGLPLRLSVNLSARQFQEMTLLHTVDRILYETGFDPADLELEVTESVAMQNADFTMNLLRDLRRRKISIAIDDFGAGQSSLIYLRQFPINNIKIDKVFITDMLTDPTDAAIVRAVIDLAHTLHLTTTAEGVETREQMRMLKAFGCDLLQGYYISRPLPAEQLTAFLTQPRGGAAGS